MSTVVNNDNNTESTSGVNVLDGAAPAPTEQSQGISADQGAQGSSTFQSQSTGSTQAKSTKQPSASSGMFKNIQKYVEKNKPQAQKMATAATGDFSKKAAEIQKNTEAKAAQQAQGMEANTKAMEDQRKFAQGQIDQAMGVKEAPAPMENGPTQEDQDKKFQGLMAGKIGGVNQVQDLNLSQQKSKADALQRLAKGTESEQGRRNLLKETFQKQGKYTQGMSGLDNLITSGDRAARESIIKGTDAKSRALQDMMRSTAQDSRGLLSDQQARIGAFGGEIGGMAQDAITAQDKVIQDALKVQQDRLGEGQQDFIKSLETGEGLTAESLEKYLGEESIVKKAEKAESDRQSFMNAMSQSGKDPVALRDYLLSNENNPFVQDLLSQVQSSSKYASEPGSEELNLYGLSNYLTGATETSEGMGHYSGSSLDKPSTIVDRTRASELHDLMQSADPITKDYITQQMINQAQGGKDLSNIYTATDPSSITASSSVDPKQLQKLNALAKLSGKEMRYDIPTDQEALNYGTADMSSLGAFGKVGDSGKQLTDEYGNWQSLREKLENMPKFDGSII